MLVNNNSGLISYHFESLNLPGLTQAVFTRHGGVSPSPWDSLNLGGTVGDDPRNVRDNLNKLVISSGFQVEDLVQVNQIHSKNVIVANQAMDGKSEGDAILTNTPGLLLLMRFADCVPILIVDPVNRAIGIAHAGWQGTVQEVAYHAVMGMISEYGSDPENIVAGIGPSIGPDHYEVGSDVVEMALETFEENEDHVLIRQDGKVKFDLWEANRISLSRAGVERIEISGVCTACKQQNWFSHRGSGGKTGRFGAVIGLD